MASNKPLHPLARPVPALVRADALSALTDARMRVMRELEAIPMPAPFCREPERYNRLLEALAVFRGLSMSIRSHGAPVYLRPR